MWDISFDASFWMLSRLVAVFVVITLHPKCSEIVSISIIDALMRLGEPSSTGLLCENPVIAFTLCLLSPINLLDLLEALIFGTKMKRSSEQHVTKIIAVMRNT